jgi:hypothetical protein
MGRRSSETSESLKKWLQAHTAKRILKRAGKGNPPLPGDEIE